MRSAAAAGRASGAPVIRFLLDRLDDDDAEVDRAARRESRGGDCLAVADGTFSIKSLRANLVAKRHVIGDLQQLLVLRDLPSEIRVRQLVMSALCSMTMPYRDHRQFNPDWADWIEDNDPLPESSAAS